MPALPILTRNQWGARPFKNPRRRVPIRSRKWFVIHYPGAGTPPRSVGAYAKWIERIHMDQNGWSGVGYNYFIGPDGQIAEGCGRDVVGAHSPPHNVDGIGVNLWTSNGQPTEASLIACRRLYEQLSDQAGHRLRIGFHGMDYPTECPGSTLRAWAKAGMPVNATVLPSKPTSPATPPETGVLGMTETIGRTDHTNHDVTPGATVSLPVDGRYAQLTGPVDEFTLTAEVHVSGLAEGESCNVALVSTNYKGAEPKPLAEQQVRGGTGWSKANVTKSGELAKGRQIRVRVTNQTSHPVRVEYTAVSGLHS